MPLPSNLSGHKAIDTYYTAISTYQTQAVTHEQATRLAFSTLLDTLSKTVGWTLVLEQTLSNRKRPDGTLYDGFKLPRGYWEAKDTHDNLDTEIKTKIARGYPLTNIIFEDTQRAVLYQNSRPVFEADLRQRTQLVQLLTQFFSYTGEQIEEFHSAVREFQQRIPELARGVLERIEDERGHNKKFVAAFDTFQQICRNSIDPNISVKEIEEMLVQHLLTERLFRTVFNDPDFTNRNVIAVEIEKVIRALTSRSFNRTAFLKSLDYFYVAIEAAAQTINDFSQKQTFLNTVYERFFQGFSKDQADTHGIVYTPQPIVDFMINSVDEVLKQEFGLSLSSEGVKILDPATGTGNFIVNILRKINRRDLKRKYRDELFANEIMLLPYYIASLNIEHAYYDLAGEYEPFEGICFADTLDLESVQRTLFFSEENTERILRQNDAEITVVIGNPPYNAGQQNENDNNKNRRYKIVDKHISDTYVKDSKATKTKAYDAYIRFFRWATDRLRGNNGIVCFVTNNGFLNGIGFDGFRKHLLRNFAKVYHLNLGGNARRQGGGNVFGIRLGVGITILVQHRNDSKKMSPLGQLFYSAVDDTMNATEKLQLLRAMSSISSIGWQDLQPDLNSNWLTEGSRTDFQSFISMGIREARVNHAVEHKMIFQAFSLGVSTNRDSVVYDFNTETLAKRVRNFIEDYNAEVSRWVEAGRPKKIDDFVRYENIKWSRNLKRDLLSGKRAKYNSSYICQSTYRPFSRVWLYHADILVDEQGGTGTFFPNPTSETENVIIALTDIGSEKPFMVCFLNTITDLHFVGAGAGTQCFPFYTYSEDGSNRRENITDWSLAQFQAQYGSEVTKWDIFYYVYGVLHSPQYRERYAENLKRELPRIPFVAPAAFRTFVETGKRLAELHLNYETVKEYPLTWIENKDVPFSWRVEKMRLSKDKTQLKVNESLTLTGIPPECFAYRLGNRSALEWVIDQYQVSTDKRSGITSDPNRDDDEEYIVRLVGRVITVSMQTVELVKALPIVVEESVDEPAA